MITLVRPVSPELVLVDPELARRLRGDGRDAGVREDDVYDANASNVNGNGGDPAVPQARPEETRSLEALLFHGGLITADQLGDLIREQTATGVPVEELVRSRGYVQPEVLDRLLGRAQTAPTPPQSGAFSAPIELVPAQAAPPSAAPEPAPEPPSAVPVETPSVFEAPAVVAAPTVVEAPMVVEASAVVETPVAFEAPAAQPAFEPAAAEVPAAPETIPAPETMAAPAPGAVAEAAPAPVVELPTPPAVVAAPAPVAEAPAPAIEIPAPAAPAIAEPEALPTEPTAEEVRTEESGADNAVVFDVLVRLTDGYELVASSHTTLADAAPAARALAGCGEWLDVGDALVQRPAVTAILVRPRISRGLD